MKTQIAVRNLRLCTKDCLCLYVCPTVERCVHGEQCH